MEPSDRTRTPNSSEASAPLAAAHRDAEPGIAGLEGDGEAGDRPDQHHALDAEIEHAALLDDEFAGRGEQDRRRHADDRDERRDEEIEAHVALLATCAAVATLGRARSIRMRRRTSTSLARMRNSIIAWKIPAVELGTWTTVCATWPPT